MTTLNPVKLIILSLTLTVASCSGLQSFNEYARAGDTIAVAAGMKPDFSKNNISVTITPSSGPDILLTQGDPAIRAVINLYPDPVSSLIVSRETNQNLTPYALTYANTTTTMAQGDIDWFQTTVFIDLPADLPIGTTNIEISNTQGITTYSTVEVIDGTGTPSVFNAEIAGPLTPVMLESLARVSHYVVSFNATTLPYAIEINLSHDPEAANGGTGKAVAINPTGYKKNLTWSDDGYNMKVILLPAEDLMINSEKDFKFYVAGEITGLNIIDIKGYSIDGIPVQGVTAGITQSN